MNHEATPVEGPSDAAAFLEWLAHRHAERTGLTLAQAREHVGAIAVSARVREDGDAEPWPDPPPLRRRGAKYSYGAA